MVPVSNWVNQMFPSGPAAMPVGADPGEIPAERIGLPGIFVSRVVRKTVVSTLPKHGPARRGHDVPRTYNGKPAWTRRQMAELAASLLPEGAYVNLGLGIPSYLSSCAGDRQLILHGENGILGYGEIVPDDQTYPDVFNASGYPVTPSPGISYFDSVTAFEMVRAGKIDVVVLGAYQVDSAGNVANWRTPEQIGGGMDRGTLQRIPRGDMSRAVVLGQYPPRLGVLQVHPVAVVHD